MKKAVLTALTLAATMLAWADPPPAAISAKLKGLRVELADEKAKLVVSYRFGGLDTPPADESLSPMAQAAKRAKEAALARAVFKTSGKPLAVVARSPWGGGETRDTYWPAGVKADFLGDVTEPIAKLGLKAVFPEMPELATRPAKTAASTASGTAPAAPPPARPKTAAEILAEIDHLDSATPKPGPGPRPAPVAASTQPAAWPKLGLPDPAEAEFFLVVGVHHEIVPYEGVRRTDDDKVVYSRASRVNAWAILFYAPTGCALWGTMAIARVGHRDSADPMNDAASQAVNGLEFGELGKDNLGEYIDQLTYQKELPKVDVAALLVQTQRPDAVLAVAKAAIHLSAYKTSAAVLRYYNEKGAPQDYRLATPKPDVPALPDQKLTLAQQRVSVRLLLLEQLRGLRATWAAAALALVPQEEDLDMPILARNYTGTGPPLGPDDELLLIAELAAQDPKFLFSDLSGNNPKNLAAAIRNVGGCKTYLDAAAEVAKFYAERRPPQQPGKPPRPPDQFNHAGHDAIAAISKTRTEQDARKGAAPQP